MLSVIGNSRIFLYAEPVNMRKSFEGLCTIVEQSLMEKPTSGAYFVFLNRQKDRIKVLYWDVDGLAIWYKRLEKGHFLCKASGENLMTRREFFMLLEGLAPKRLNPRYNIV